MTVTASLVLAVAAIWWSFSLIVLLNLLASPSLPRRDDSDPSRRCQPADSGAAAAPLPSVSIIVAARNEAARIEQGVRGLMAQQGIDLEITVVDDRSTDATPQILARLAAEFPALRVVRVDSLPAGWLGKCHAMSLGAKNARGGWLLFTDADIHMSPDLVARALAKAADERADHLCLWPTVNCTAAATRGVMLAWSQCLAIYAPAWSINRDRGRRAIGIGAFNLMRAEAYRAIGGHEPLRMEVVDDVKLGLLLRRGGFRQRVYTAFADLEADFAHSVPGAVRIVEKNWFAGVGYSVAKSAASILLFAVLWFAALAGPWLAPGVVGWAALASLWAPAIPAVVQIRRAGWPAWVLPLVPLGYLVFCWAGIHSTTKTLRQGGIRWRDTFYPLAELRAGMVR